jgi:hypothetical protein
MHVPTPPNGAHPNGPSPSPAPEASPPTGADAKPTAADGGRDPHGRFTKGNAGGPGNPFARRVAALRAALLAAVTEEDLEAVARELVRQAKEGDLAAARLLLSYTLGKPAAPVDPDTLDLHEFELFRRVPDPAAEMTAAPQRLGLPLALKYLRAALPAISDTQERMMLRLLRGQEAAEQAEAAAREGRRRRQERGQKAAAPKPGAPAPAGDEKALALLGRLLGLTPSANGGDPRPGAPRPPSANGGPRADGPGGDRGA